MFSAFLIYSWYRKTILETLNNWRFPSEGPGPQESYSAQPQAAEERNHSSEMLMGRGQGQTAGLLWRGLIKCI